jgi:antitoxin component YwqK of YwqJK toxin-antitoxin module
LIITQQATWVFAKAGQTETVFQLFVFQFGFISGRRITIKLCANHQLYFINLASVSQADGSLFPSLRKYLDVSGNFMKHYQTIILVLLLTVKLNAQSFDDTTYFSKGKISSYNSYDETKKCWLVHHFYYNGNISFIDKYDSSDFTYNHSINAFNIDGTPALKYNSYYGRPAGLFEAFYYNGKIKQRGYYYNGFKTGKWHDYHINGNVELEYSFALSKEDSLFNSTSKLSNIDSIPIIHELIEWGQEDPTLGQNLRFININKFSFYYLKSSPVGTWTKYDINGKLLSSINYDK